MNTSLPLFDIEYWRPETIVIGLTGPLSAGCSTVSEYLTEQTEQKGFILRRLSDTIRRELKEKDRVEEPTPQQMQDKGDELRKSEGEAVLVKMVFTDLADRKPERIVIDGVRNPGEIKYLRKFSHFFLIAIDAAREERLRRYRAKTGIDISDQEFYAIDERDSGKNQPGHGQNVTHCIDLADFQVINDDTWDDDLTIRDNLFKKIDVLLDLIDKPGFKQPSMQEVGMHFAYSASLMSPCLKRQVGAMIAREIDSGKELAIAIGHNRPPDGIKTCHDRYQTCYRDLLKGKMQKKLKDTLHNIPGLPGTIEDDIIRSVLSDPELKQLDYCQSIHAEESAILQVAKLGGVSLGGTTLYTTTFPCLLCAKKIIQTGIKRIVFNEAYPMIQARDLLAQSLGRDNLIRFEGVKSLAFFKLFQPSGM